MTTNTTPFRVATATLSDGSLAHNVVGAIDQGAAGQVAITIACLDRQHALETADALNKSAWVELEPQDYTEPTESLAPWKKGPPETIGYGPQSVEAFRHGWSAAMEAVYQSLNRTTRGSL